MDKLKVKIDRKVFQEKQISLIDAFKREFFHKVPAAKLEAFH